MKKVWSCFNGGGVCVIMEKNINYKMLLIVEGEKYGCGLCTQQRVYVL